MCLRIAHLPLLACCIPAVRVLLSRRCVSRRTSRCASWRRISRSTRRRAIRRRVRRGVCRSNAPVTCLGCILLILSIILRLWAWLRVLLLTILRSDSLRRSNASGWNRLHVLLIILRVTSKTLHACWTAKTCSPTRVHISAILYLRIPRTIQRISIPHVCRHLFPHYIFFVF